MMFTRKQVEDLKAKVHKIVELMGGESNGLTRITLEELLIIGQALTELAWSMGLGTAAE
jgi:hypothetical protein